jgi:hypothetical protein
MTERDGRQPKQLASVQKRSFRGMGMEVDGRVVSGKAGGKAEVTMLTEEWMHIMYL